MTPALPPREPRFPVELPVALTVGEDGAPIPAKLLNVSNGGLCVQAACAAEVDEFLGLELEAEGHGRIALFAIVRWREQDRIGLEIGGMHPRHRHRHEELLAKLAR